MIKRNTQGKITIPTVVKLDKKLNRLELFYIDENNEITSFCYAEGHNIACKQYMHSLSHVDIETAEVFITAYNMRYPDTDNCINVYSKRLIKANYED